MIERLLDPAWPTPVLVYSQAELERAWRALPPDILIHYALKSCYRPPVLKTLLGLGAGVEVMSAMEYRLARQAGFAGEQILVNGLGRSQEFLEQAYREGARLIFDSAQELRQFGERPARIGLRLKLDLGHYGGPSKLGLQGQELKEALQLCQGPIQVDLLHVHLASQEHDSAPFEAALELLQAARKRLDQPIRSIDLGGGFESGLSQAVFERIRARFAALFPDCQLLLEPGRYLVNGAGFLVTTVMARKAGYLVVDAGTNTMMPHREATYCPLHPPAGEACRVTLVDGITSLTSVLVADLGLAWEPQPGDRIIFGNCGAYTSAMSQFWAYEPIPVAFLSTAGELQWDLSPAAVELCARTLLGA